MDLSGNWAFELDHDDVGVKDAWWQRPLNETIHLPGSLQSQGFGDEISINTTWTGDIFDRTWFEDPRYEPYRQPGQVKVPFWLQADRHFTGAAWFQKVVDIPQDWEGRRVVLTLERPHWETRLWLDGEEIGSQLSLSTPHVYDLGGKLTTGLHRLTLRVDNRMIVNVGPNAHSMSDHTQTNWNGIAGRLEISAGSPCYIQNVQIYPDVQNKKITLHASLGKSLPEPVNGRLTLSALSYNTAESHTAPMKTIQVRLHQAESLVVVDYSLGPQAQLWDEFHPALYALNLDLETTINDEVQHDRQVVSFGLRQVGVQGTQIAVNGQKTFIRGTLECCIFPLTGYPPTDVDSWKRIIQICKDHGLNNIRFHSYCPPEAAFIAADELGFYYQVECASWANQGATIGEGRPLDSWLYDEAHRIIAAYGNHPCFMLMAYGNEPSGDMVGYLSRWVSYWKEHDPRRLHTSGAGWPALPENQYHNIFAPRIHLWGAGLNSRINALPPETTTDYRQHVKDSPVPIISHEIGQWCVYPNFDEIPKYSGHVKAKNFEIFHDLLEANHMGDQAHDFLMASGKLQAICYKEEIESALRTPGFGGFHLLDLHDFPGQGTALVGVLDPFWDSKGYITPAEFRRFCNHTVPLARLAKRFWRSSEVLHIELEAAHFGPDPLSGITPAWKLADRSGKVLASEELVACDLQIGNGISLGSVDLPLSGLASPAAYVFSLSLLGTDCENDWDIWVYPDSLEMPTVPGLHISQELGDSALAHLESGGSLLWIIPAERVNTPVQIGFSSIFWNTAWTKNQPPHTLGVLCDPTHPVFEHFPTEYHSNWQWWELIKGSAALLLDGFPSGLRPLIQPIDTWFENRRLGLLFEARVGRGKLIVCAMDLENDLDSRLVARQMRFSLFNYMTSASFAPTFELTAEDLARLVK
jgi:hypothetical protein